MLFYFAIFESTEIGAYYISISRGMSPLYEAYMLVPQLTASFLEHKKCSGAPLFLSTRKAMGPIEVKPLKKHTHSPLGLSAYYDFIDTHTTAGKIVSLPSNMNIQN